nr:hypothetical protein [Planctomycetota bacterium]
MSSASARRAVAILAFCVVAVGASPRLAAAGGPEATVVVVNRDSWVSLAIANAYVRLRSIPARNVVELADVPGYEVVGCDAFRTALLAPVLAAIAERGLAGRVDCIAWSADLPYAVDLQGDVAAAAPERRARLSPYATATGSINGMTWLHELTQARDIGYLAFDVNRYMRRRLPLTDPPTEADVASYEAGMKLYEAKRYAEAMAALVPVAKRIPTSNEVHYNLACCQALCGDADAAMASLERSVACGWSDTVHTRADPDLESLRPLRTFADLLARMEAKRGATFAVQLTTAFHGVDRWDAEGARAKTGARYVLSTMLAMTSGRGTSYRQAVEGLRASAAADGTRPAGTIYFMLNDDVRSTTREFAVASAAAALAELGVKAEIIRGVLPERKADVAGAMIGSAGFDWSASGSTILPGAIVEHLTSLGGVMVQDGGQTPLSTLLAAGAAGASGTVTEPYALQAKFPLAFIHVHYARGCTLAEAFYQSVHAPYQLLIVGDPLCAPWARQPTVEAIGVVAGATVSGVLSIAPRSSGVAVARFEAYVDGVAAGIAKPGGRIAIDTSALADGWHEVAVVAIADDAVES